ncbi:hypothetical protein ACFL0W_02870 [Nanoarchaeota archaeon]
MRRKFKLNSKYKKLGESIHSILYISIFILLAVCTILSASAAEMFCDVRGFVLDENGNHVTGVYEVKVSLIDSLGLATDKIYSETVNTQKGFPPEFAEGFFYVSFSQADDCDYGETVVIELIDDEYEGKKEAIVVEQPASGTFDIELSEINSNSDGSSSGGGTADPSNNLIGEQPVAQVISSQESQPAYRCLIEGYVIKKGTNTSVDKGEISIKVKDETYKINLTQGPPPEYKKGYFYFDKPDLNCENGELITLSFDEGCLEGSKTINFNSLSERSSDLEIFSLTSKNLEGCMNNLDTEETENSVKNNNNETIDMQSESAIEEESFSNERTLMISSVISTFGLIFLVFVFLFLIFIHYKRTDLDDESRASESKKDTDDTDEKKEKEGGNDYEVPEE